MNNDDTRQSLLREYLAVIRRRRRAILLVTAVGVLVALAISFTQDKTYTATATFRTKDISESLSLAGLLPKSGDLPSVQAAQGAEVATDSSVLDRVRKDLDLKETNDELKSRISATQDVQSNLITVSADAPTADGAATLANAVTAAAVVSANETVKKGYASLAAGVRSTINKLGAGPTADVELAAKRQTLIQQASRLDALSAVADVADRVTSASPPASPSAPKPARSAILGGILGLIVGLLVAGVLESLDRRLRRPDDVQAELRYPLVGVVSSSAMGGVPIAGIPADEHVAAMDAFRMLRTNVSFLGRAGSEDGDAPRTVLVTSPLPDEGKTTLAIGYALAAAAAGDRVLLVEADFHRPVHAERLGLNYGPGLADFLAGEANPQDVLQVREFVDPALAKNDDSAQTSSLVCITAGNRESWSGDMLSSGKFEKFIDQIGKVYDLVIIDSGPMLAVAETLEIVRYVDAVLFCVRLGQTTREQAKVAKETLNRLPERPTGIVTTGMKASDSDGYSYYGYAYSYRFDTRPPETREKAEASSAKD